MNKGMLTSATHQVWQHWFSVGIIPLGLLFGLTGIENRRSQITCNPPMRVAS